jgi:translation initiation factor eIF-2B subunit alpha
MAVPDEIKEDLSGDTFDVVSTYRRLLAEDEELTMPVAAIETLILALASTPASTVSETLDLVSKLTAQLKQSIPNSISLSAGTDLFQQYLISNLQRPSARGDFDQIRSHLVDNGKLFVTPLRVSDDISSAMATSYSRTAGRES